MILFDFVLNVLCLILNTFVLLFLDLFGACVNSLFFLLCVFYVCFWMFIWRGEMIVAVFDGLDFNLMFLLFLERNSKTKKIGG